MIDLRKAAKMALYALEFNDPLIEDFGSKEQLKSHNEAIAALYKTLAQPEQEPVAHAVIAGVLFDFMGWLTSRQERLVLSSCDDASSAVKVIEEFAKMRGLSLGDAKVQDWQDMTSPPRQALAQPEQSKYSDIVSDGGLDPRNKFDAQPEQAPKLTDAGVDTNIPLWGLEPKGKGWLTFHQSNPEHQPWCDYLNIMLTSMPPQKAKCNCKQAPPKPEPKSISTNDHLCAMLRQVHDVLACTALPMKRQWVGLTDDERNEMVGRIQHDQYTRQRDLIGNTQIITEMYLKEKNNAV